MIEAGLRRASKYVFAAADRLTSPPTGPRILIYHRVGLFHGQQMEVSVDDFAEQLDWLEKNAEVVDLDVAIERWDEEDSRRLVVLTFDDGYEDTATTAFPLLEARGFPFTLYIATRQVEEARIAGPEQATRSLNWHQINAMLSSGLMTIGAHTHTHRDMRDATEEQIQEELDLSDALIEERTGVRPVHFAYPWGYWSRTAHDLVAGRYETAVLGGSPRSRRTLERHRIPRFPVQRSDGAAYFERRLTGGLLLEERVRRLLRGYRGP